MEQKTPPKINSHFPTTKNTKVSVTFGKKKTYALFQAPKKSMKVTIPKMIEPKALAIIIWTK